LYSDYSVIIGPANVTAENISTAHMKKAISIMSRRLFSHCGGGVGGLKANCPLPPTATPVDN